MQDIKKYVEENKQRFLDELFELLRFPSVSADPKYKDDVQNAADFVAQKLTRCRSGEGRDLSYCWTSYCLRRENY